MSKKKNQLVLIVSALVSSVMLMSCSAQHTNESTGQFVDSTVVTTKVKAKLLADKSVKSLPITVKTYKNTVQLSGFVNTNQQKNKAALIAKNVEGVQDVQNDLIVKSH